MVLGSVRVKVIFYKSKSSFGYYENGFSHWQQINNANQEETAFNQAMSNAIHKFAYRQGQKYDDTEFNYELVESHILYSEYNRKENKYVRFDRPSNLSPSDKRRIHKAIILQAKSRANDENKYQTKEEYMSMFAEKDDIKSKNMKMTKHREVIEKRKKTQRK
jgi:hypothetical protein